MIRLAIGDPAGTFLFIAFETACRSIPNEQVQSASSNLRPAKQSSSVNVYRPCSLRALRCVDRVVPIRDWSDLKDVVRNLRIDLIVVRPEQVQQFADQEVLGAEVVTI